MDYEGNYFPDEEEEELPRAKKIRKKIIRYSFYSLIIAVYVIAFVVIFANCEHKIYEEYIFSPKANELYKADPDAFAVYELFPRVFMNYDGSVQISGVAYAENASELELGIKYNKNLLINEKGEGPEFSLVDSDGKVYKLCNSKAATKGRYNYLRLCFEGVVLDLDGNRYINSEASTAADGEGEMFETFNYKLVIKYPENADIKTDAEDEEKETDAFVIFDGATAIQPVDFK